MSAFSFEKILDKVSVELEDSLVFAGALDNNAKLLSFRKGSGKLALPVERHETLDVQISLFFSLLHQLEDIAGNHRFTMTRFQKYNIYLFGTDDIHLFVVSSSDSADTTTSFVSVLAGITADEPPKGPILRREQVEAQPILPPARKPVTPAVVNPEHHRPAKPLQAGSRRAKSEVIAMLQGYLMGSQSDLEVDEDEEGYLLSYRDGRGGKLAYSLVEKLNSTFGDKIEVTSIDVDENGRLLVRILPRD